jgi:hypothetical protein
VKVTVFWVATPCNSESSTFRRNITSIFRVKEYAKRRNQEKQVASSACCLLIGLLFDSDDVSQRAPSELHGVKPQTTVLFRQMNHIHLLISHMYSIFLLGKRMVLDFTDWLSKCAISYSDTTLTMTGLGFLMR